uniref:Disease resistance R13L4/SHOC-2-like LRR domain-containing protein n=1 Tax=Oryza meridionalis TaxID=40149 RepID=A0A0E0CLS5_9ORYZ
MERQNNETKLELHEFDNIRVVLNINAHVYHLPESLLSYFGSQLVVLQLGRWWNFDDNTYIEVEGLEKLSAIGNLKNLRYLDIHGLSKLIELPKEVNQLQQLEVLDVHGCQNLTRVMSSAIKMLRRYRNKVCHLQDLGARMKNLRKLGIYVSTNADVDKNEMGQLRHLNSLLSLTITLGELASILKFPERIEEKNKVLVWWTSLVLPPNLMKLDARCYPKKEIPYDWFQPKEHSKPTMLTKLYVRGGAMKRLKLPQEKNINILRLKYLNELKMQYNEMFHMMKNLRYVEIVIKQDKVMMSEKRKYRAEYVEPEPYMVREERKKAQEEEEKLMTNIKEIMGIPKSILDEHGVWESDQKEAAQNMKEKAQRVIETKARVHSSPTIFNWFL